MANFEFSPGSHPEPSRNFNTDSNGRPLRKSCRFCRSRKIRCTGQTGGCSACTTRDQDCIYEPTAAMGRPRKYPRTGGSPTPQPFQPSLFVPTGMSVWDSPSPAFGSRMSASGGFGLANPQVPFASTSHAPVPAWRQSSLDLTTSLFDSSHLTSSAPYQNCMSGLPPPSEPRHNLHQPTVQDMSSYDDCGSASQHHCTTAGVLLNGSSMPASSSRHQQPAIQASTPLGFSFNTTTGFDYKECSSTQSSIDQMRPEAQFNVERGTNPITHPEGSQSPEAPFAPPDVFAEFRPWIYASDVDAIHQYFKGWALSSVTHYHLEFILHERPNPGISDSTFQYPRMTSSSLYNTMLADIVSFMTCARPSAPNVYEPTSTPYVSLFAQMLECDRGGNEPVGGTPFASLNPVDYHTGGELKNIYSHFLRGNPFRRLFENVNVQLRGDHRAFDAALVATIVGWNLFERSRRYTENLHAPCASSCPSHMPYFEFAEEELMKRALWETQNAHSILSTVQALTLLGAFRTIDGQPRCGWALLSVAHLLARQATLQTLAGKRSMGNQKRARSDDMASDTQLNGLFWLLTLVRIWTGLSLQLPHESVVSILRPGTCLPVCDQDQGWAGRLLLDAAQVLDVFSTICREELATRFWPKGMAQEDPDFVGNWLADIARRRCQVSRSHLTSPNESPELLPTLGATSNPHANPTLAVILSILTLNKNHPFRTMSLDGPEFPMLPTAPNTPEMLQIATSEAAGAVGSILLDNPADVLTLRILRGAFPYLVVIINAAISNVGAGNEIERGRLESTLDFLSSFIGAGLSLYQREDQMVVDRLRACLLSYFPPQSQLLLSSQDPLDVPALESFPARMVNNKPVSLGLTTSYSNNTSCNSSSATLTGGSKSSLNPPSSTRSPAHIQRETELPGFVATYPVIESYGSMTSYGSQGIYDHGMFQDYPPQTSIQRQVSLEDVNRQITDESEMSRSSGSSPAFSTSH